MEFSAFVGPIALCVVTIIVAAAVYFVVTLVKGKAAERKEQQAWRDLEAKRPRRRS